MSNPFEEFTVAKPPGAPEGNPFAPYIHAPVADETQQEVISEVNNPNKPSPEHFGLYKIPLDATRGALDNLLSAPATAGQSLIEAGELSKNDSKGIIETIKNSFTKRVSENLIENKGKLSLFDMAKIGLGIEKDALLSSISGSKAPDVMINAGNAMVAQNKAALDAIGLSKNDQDGLAYDFGSGAGSVISSIGATAITKNPIYAAAYMGWVQNADSYKEARAAGKSPEEAMQLAGVDAYTQGLIEKFGGHIFLGVAKESSLLRKTLLRGAGQAGEETAQAAVDETIMNESGVRNKSWQDIALSIAYQGFLGFAVGAPVSAVVGAMERTGEEVGASKKTTQEIIDNLVKNKEMVVNASAEILQNEASGVMRDPNSEQQIADIIKEATAEKKEAPSLMKQIETDYTTQAEEIKAQLSNQELDLSKPSTLRKAIGYVPESISSFIKRTGGITDAGAELKARGIDYRRLSGLIRKAKGEQNVKELMAGMSENAVVGNDAVKQRVFDAGYFPEKTDYNEISDSELYDAIAKDLTSGERHYNATDRQRIDEYFAKNPNVEDKYAQMGISKDMSPQEIGAILRENDAPKFKEVTADMNDPRFSGELDMANSTLNEKTIKSKGQIFDEVLAAKKKKGSVTLKGFKGAISDLPSMVNAAITPISTRLRNLNAKLGARLRKFEFDRNQQINADQEAVKPFLEKYTKLSNTDREILDFAMRNGDRETIKEIAQANDMGAEIDVVRTTLDGLYKRAQSVGLDIGYRKNFFPRYVSEPKAMLDYFAKTEAWSDIQSAITRKEVELGRLLEDSEKAYLINTLLRGYSVEQITLSRPGALKERMIDVVTPEINNFYGSTDQAIMRYVTTVNDAIETRKFFGKESKINEFEKIEDSIGFFVLKEMEKGNITPSQAQELSKIMKARFARGKMNAFLQGYRSINYIATMGSPISAISQLADLGIAFYKNGVYRTLSTLPRAIVGKSKLTAADIGVTQILQEFDGESTSANAVRKVFKAVGLEKMDAIGKEVIINSAIKRYRALAKKPTEDFRSQLDVIFGEETDQVIQDLKDGKNSQNVKLLLFNELLDLQPVALSEMPETYLRSGNGRILYMLKSYTVKQFDIYRHEVFDQIRKDPVQGMKNLTRLLTFYVLMNASTDFLKDLILGRDTPVEDQVVNNVARIFGLSKYNVYTARREGLGTAAWKTIAPPVSLIDQSFKDMNTLYENGEIDMDELETLQSIPFAGKMLYWWFGAGADK